MDEKDKDILERGLPLFLQKDIDAWLAGQKTNSTVLDCLHNELYGSINSAFWGREISEKQKDYLFEKYLGL